MNFENLEIIDITPEINEKIAVFPGDTPFQRRISMSTDQGELITLSSILSTLHLGAHADAPNHYSKSSEGISSRSLNYYLGSCEVIEVQLNPKKLIHLHDFDLDNICSKRVLFKTNSFNDPYHWNENFNAIAPETIKALSEKGVFLVGIDTPSIDLSDSKELLAHKMVFEKNMAILEGIILSKVESGSYHLIALPLKIKNADASPVRAILVKN